MLTPVLLPLRRLAVMGGIALILASLRISGRPHTLCLFRAATGLPCPLCGGTTAAVRVGQGRLLAAFLANPVVVLGAIMLVVAGSPPGQHAVRSWRALPTSARLWAGATVLVLSECWQLTRFGLF